MRDLRSLLAVGSAYRAFFASPSGRVVLKDLIRTCGLYRPSGAQDAAQLQYMEGARDMVRRILRLARFSDRDLEKLLQESVDE